MILPKLQQPFSKLLVVPTTKLGNSKAVRSLVHHINQGLTGQDVYRPHSPYQRKEIVKALRPHSTKLGMSPDRWGKWLNVKTTQLFERFHANDG